MQHSSWPESGRHLWLFSSRLSKHTLQTLQWNDLSLWILSEQKKLTPHRKNIAYIFIKMHYRFYQQSPQLAKKKKRLAKKQPKTYSFP